MSKRLRLLSLFFAALIVLAPNFADARAGGSYGGRGGGSFGSMGSMGSRSFGFNNGGQPLQRSLTPQTAPSAGQPGGYGYGGMGYHPFLSGIAGGFFGSWIGSMLFPHWGMGGYGGYGGGGFGLFGSLFSWLILLGLIWMVIRFFTRGVMTRGVSTAPMNYGTMGGSGLGLLGSSGYRPAAQAQGAPLAISGPDYQSFETILKQVQGAWSRGDLNALRAVTTPEMLSYFAEELAENQSRGVVNHVDQVELLRGDLREAWDEGRLQYATCYLSWRALDYSVRAGGQPGEAQLITDGDPHQPSQAAELWTFARTPGGQWLLSAIQQV
jgi:predicted lipid-binding transport protein (Tim44 family)